MTISMDALGGAPLAAKAPQQGQAETRQRGWLHQLEQALWLNDGKKNALAQPAAPVAVQGPRGAAVGTAAEAGADALGAPSMAAAGAAAPQQGGPARMADPAAQGGANAPAAPARALRQDVTAAPPSAAAAAPAQLAASAAASTALGAGPVSEAWRATALSTYSVAGAMAPLAPVSMAAAGDKPAAVLKADAAARTPAPAPGLAAPGQGAALAEAAGQATDSAAPADSAPEHEHAEAAPGAQSASETLTARRLHLYQGEEGVQAWIRDASIAPDQAQAVARAVASELLGAGTRVAALSVNGKKQALAAGQWPEQFDRSAAAAAVIHSKGAV